MQNMKNRAKLILLTVKAMIISTYNSNNNNQLVRNPIINSNGFLVKGVGILCFQMDVVDVKIKKKQQLKSTKAKR